MDFDSYQNAALRTAGDISLPVLGLGVAGEAGEVADLIKKHIGHGHDLDRSKVGKELGDVLWYVTVLAERVGLSLESVAAQNIAKLRARYPDGFSVEASKAKADEDEIADALHSPGDCPAISRNAYYCTRTKGHAGDHIAGTGTAVVHRWGQQQ